MTEHESSHRQAKTSKRPSIPSKFYRTPLSQVFSAVKHRRNEIAKMQTATAQVASGLNFTAGQPVASLIEYKI